MGQNRFVDAALAVILIPFFINLNILYKANDIDLTQVLSQVQRSLSPLTAHANAIALTNLRVASLMKIVFLGASHCNDHL